MLMTLILSGQEISKHLTLMDIEHWVCGQGAPSEVGQAQGEAMV